MGFPRDYLDFTTWYLTKKGYIITGRQLGLLADGGGCGLHRIATRESASAEQAADGWQRHDSSSAAQEEVPTGAVAAAVPPEQRSRSSFRIQRRSGWIGEKATATDGER